MVADREILIVKATGPRPGEPADPARTRGGRDRQAAHLRRAPRAGAVARERSRPSAEDAERGRSRCSESGPQVVARSLTALNEGPDRARRVVRPDREAGP